MTDTWTWTKERSTHINLWKTWMQTCRCAHACTGPQVHQHSCIHHKVRYAAQSAPDHVQTSLFTSMQKQRPALAKLHILRCVMHGVCERRPTNAPSHDCVATGDSLCKHISDPYQEESLRTRMRRRNSVCLATCDSCPGVKSTSYEYPSTSRTTFL